MAFHSGVLLTLALVGQAIASRPAETGLAMPDACQTCIVGIRVLEDYLCDPASVDFLVAFAEKRVCPAFGDTPRCHNLAEGLLPVMVQWLRTATTPATLCSAAGVCGTAMLQNSLYNKPAKRVHDGMDCALCKYMVSEAKSALNGTTIMDDLKEQMLEVCSDLPDQMAESCTRFVNQYEPLVAIMIESLDSSTICTLVGVCGEALAKMPLPALPLELVQPLARAQHLLGQAKRPGRLAPSNDDGCDYCKMAVLEVHSLIANPSVQQSLVNYTKAICDSFPNIATECKVYVEQYAVLVFSLAEQYLVPDTLCVQLGMCPPPPGYAATSSILQVLSKSVLGMLGLDRQGNAQPMVMRQLQRRVR